MAHPHKANDKDEELEDLDPAVAEDLAFARALQNSLESFEQEQGNTVQAPEDHVKVPEYTREAPDDTGDIPRLSFTAEEIAQDEVRREQELYGPPSPLRESRTATSWNPQNDATKPSEKKSEKTSDKSSVRDTGYHLVKDAIAKGIARSKLTKRDSLADKILAVKMGLLLSAVQCPSAYGDVPQDIMSGITGSEGAVAAAAVAAAAAAAAEAEPDVQGAEAPAHGSRGWNSPSSSTAGVAGSEPRQASPDQSPDMAAGHAQAAVEQVVPETVDTTIKDDPETAVVGNVAPPESSSSALDAVIAFDVAHASNESALAAQHFDDRIARTHAARLAIIEADLARADANLEAALGARHAGGIARGAPVAVSAQAEDPSRQAAGDSTGDEEMEWFLDEFPVSPRPGSEEAQSPRQRSQSQ